MLQTVSLNPLVVHEISLTVQDLVYFKNGIEKKIRAVQYQDQTLFPEILFQLNTLYCVYWVTI